MRRNSHGERLKPEMTKKCQLQLHRAKRRKIRALCLERIDRPSKEAVTSVIPRLKEEGRKSQLRSFESRERRMKPYRAFHRQMKKRTPARVKSPLVFSGRL